MQIVIRLLNLDWVGNKNTDNEKFNDMQYVLDQAVEGLGYGMVESNSDIYNLAQFGNEDQTINRFVKKISDKPLTWSQANEEASNNKLNYDTSTFLDADGYTMLNANDSATLIANVGTLPDGTEITWKTAPKFDNDGILTNTPVISVKEPDKAELEVTLTDEDKAQLHTPSYGYTLEWKNEPLIDKIEENGNHITKFVFL